MKTTIETNIRFLNRYDAVNVLNEFNEILRKSRVCVNIEDLKSAMFTYANLVGWNKFRYGFGSNHMWVKQIGVIDAERLLLITE